MFGHVYMLAGGPNSVAIQVGDEGGLFGETATAAVRRVACSKPCAPCPATP